MSWNENVVLIPIGITDILTIVNGVSEILACFLFGIFQILLGPSTGKCFCYNSSKPMRPIQPTKVDHSFGLLACFTQQGKSVGKRMLQV